MYVTTAWSFNEDLFDWQWVTNEGKIVSRIWPDTRVEYVGAQADDGECALCIIGRFKQFANALVCTICPDGTHGIKDHTSCRDCPAGYIGLSPSTNQCTPCPLGTYSDQTRVESGIECKVCDKGQYTNKTSSSSCTFCPSGRFNGQDGTNSLVDAQYHNSLSTCEQCPILYFNPFKGKDKCYLCLTAETIGAITCDGCNVGFFERTSINITTGEQNVRR